MSVRAKDRRNTARIANKIEAVVVQKRNNFTYMYAYNLRGLNMGRECLGRDQNLENWERVFRSLNFNGRF